MIGNGIGIGISLGKKVVDTSPQYGIELVNDYNFTLNNGSFTTNTGATKTIGGGNLNLVTTQVAGAYQAITTEVGKTYRVLASSNNVHTGMVVRVNTGSVPSATPIIDISMATGVGDNTFVAVQTTTCIYMRHPSAGTSDWQLLSVKEVL